MNLNNKTRGDREGKLENITTLVFLELLSLSSVSGFPSSKPFCEDVSLVISSSVQFHNEKFLLLHLGFWLKNCGPCVSSVIGFLGIHCRGKCTKHIESIAEKAVFKVEGVRTKRVRINESYRDGTLLGIILESH